MTLFKNKFKGDWNRLKNWDYSGAAVYFMTIVTKNRECLFGSVEDHKMVLNDTGQIIENELLKSATAKQINKSVSIWQSNYHDHSVRDYKSFENIYNYIKANPHSWEMDCMKH